MYLNKGVVPAVATVSAVHRTTAPHHPGSAECIDQTACCSIIRMHRQREREREREVGCNLNHATGFCFVFGFRLFCSFFFSFKKTKKRDGTEEITDRSITQRLSLSLSGPMERGGKREEAGRWQRDATMSTTTKEIHQTLFHCFMACAAVVVLSL